MLGALTYSLLDNFVQRIDTLVTRLRIVLFDLCGWLFYHREKKMCESATGVHSITSLPFASSDQFHDDLLEQFQIKCQK